MGLGSAVSRLVADRRSWQAIPAAVLVLALGAVGVSGLGRNQPVTGALPSTSAIALPSVSPAATPTAAGATGLPATTAPSGSPAATPTPVLTPAPTRTPVPTPQATATPRPSARTTYTVKAGDTLYGIAGTFGTTVAAIKELNGLTSNNIRVGLVLLIP